MPNLYIEQPELSSSEVATLLREKGLDFAAWPQSVLPEQLLPSMDPEINSAKTAPYPPEDPVAARALRALIRTSWGLLLGSKMEADPENDMDFATYSVEVHYAKGWDSEELGYYSDACIELLSPSLTAFRKKNRKADVQISDGAGDEVVEIFATCELADGKAGEEKAREGLLKYLFEILENGMLDRVIEVGCADAIEETAAVELMLGMRPDLHAKVG